MDVSVVGVVVIIVVLVVVIIVVMDVVGGVSVVICSSDDVVLEIFTFVFSVDMAEGDHGFWTLQTDPELALLQCSLAYSGRWKSIPEIHFLIAGHQKQWNVLKSWTQSSQDILVVQVGKGQIVTLVLSWISSRGILTAW